LGKKGERKGGDAFVVEHRAIVSSSSCYFLRSAGLRDAEDVLCAEERGRKKTRVPAHTCSLPRQRLRVQVFGEAATKAGRKERGRKGSRKRGEILGRVLSICRSLAGDLLSGFTEEMEKKKEGGGSLSVSPADARCRRQRKERGNRGRSNPGTDSDHVPFFNTTASPRLTWTSPPKRRGKEEEGRPPQRNFSSDRSQIPQVATIFRREGEGNVSSRHRLPRHLTCLPWATHNERARKRGRKGGNHRRPSSAFTKLFYRC